VDTLLRSAQLLATLMFGFLPFRYFCPAFSFWDVAVMSRHCTSSIGLVTKGEIATRTLRDGRTIICDPNARSTWLLTNTPSWKPCLRSHAMISEPLFPADFRPIVINIKLYLSCILQDRLGALNLYKYPWSWAKPLFNLSLLHIFISPFPFSYVPSSSLGGRPKRSAYSSPNS
jgi:hypothetical protein